MVDKLTSLWCKNCDEWYTHSTSSSKKMQSLWVRACSIGLTSSVVSHTFLIISQRESPQCLLTEFTGGVPRISWLYPHWFAAGACSRAHWSVLRHIPESFAIEKSSPLKIAWKIMFIVHCVDMCRRCICCLRPVLKDLKSTFYSSQNSGWATPYPNKSKDLCFEPRSNQLQYVRFDFQDKIGLNTTAWSKYARLEPHA